MPSKHVHAGSGIAFLTTDEVVRLHHHAIARHGGSLGIRDAGLLDSAVHSPQGTFGGGYVYGDIFEMAAALLQHLICNHAFVDGNKRTAWYATKAFLLLNGYSCKPRRKDLVESMVAIADGRLRGKLDIAAWLRDESEES